MPDITPYDRRGHNLWNGLDNFERMFFENFGSPNMAFRTDIVDEGDHYLLSAELPGFDKKDINVEVDGANLLISAKKNTESNVREEHYVRRERRSGAYARSFDVTGIQSDKIKASYKDGVLHVTLPKASDAGEKGRKIDLE